MKKIEEPGGSNSAQDLPVINPDVGRVLNPETIAIGSKHVLANDITHDNVALLPDEETNSDQLWLRLIRVYSRFDKWALT